MSSPSVSPRLSHLEGDIAPNQPDNVQETSPDVQVVNEVAIDLFAGVPITVEEGSGLIVQQQPLGLADLPANFFDNKLSFAYANSGLNIDQLLAKPGDEVDTSK